MKRITTLLLTTLLVCTYISPATAQKNDDGVLRILAIGNSFSDDGMEHLPALLESLGVKDVELARLYVGGCTLARHMEFYNKQEAAYLFYHSKAGENRWTQHNGVTMQQALAMGEWDIITMQQASGVSGLYDSYVPHLEQLIEVVSKVQPQAEIVWHMTWAYSIESQHPEFPNYDRNQQKMLDAIHQCVRNLKRDYKIKTIIPSGTAIQSLRLSEVNNPPMEFTRDGYHMDYGAGRYAAACTWYETLIKPYTRRSMMGNTLRLEMGNLHVTDQNAPYLQKAAKRAAKRPFKVRAVMVK
ncbi:MAG: DUF4886 domain-containing protein [Alistipes sp.]|nr:DUF4886 domain-containing protein [Alistipes sp.]